MPRQWFIKTKSGRVGPLSSSKLSRMARSGRLLPNMGVSQDGESWIKAKRIPGLSFPEVDSVDAGDSDAKTTTDEWYVLTKRDMAGPFTHRQLRKLASQGRIAANVGVSRNKVKWTKAKKVPGLEFPVDASETIAEATESGATPQATTADRGPAHMWQSYLSLLIDEEPFQRITRPRQQTWFGIDPTESGVAPRPTAPTENVWPLFHWPPSTVQRSLSFDDVAESKLSQLQQLNLTLFVGDEPFADYRFTQQQQTLFPVGNRFDRKPVVDGSRLNDHFPLFAWPPTSVQQSLPFGVVAEASSPSRLHQLDLSLKVGDRAFTDYRYTYRQQTLFYVDSQTDPNPRQHGTPSRDHFPLFAWPSRQTQLRLFVGEALATDQDGLDSDVSPHQLKLRLHVGDGESHEFPLVMRPRQLSFFRIEPRSPQGQHAAQSSAELGCPLFNWPPDAVQLRLFDEAAQETEHGDEVSLEVIERVDVQIDVPSSSEPISDEPSTERTVHWLHTQWAQTRESEYVRQFGPYSHIARPQDPLGVAVDVYVFPPSAQRPITTLVTSGMSNHRMPIAEGPCSPRAELILYVDEVQPEYVNLLYCLAQIPQRQNMALRYGSAMSHGDPAQPIFENSPLDGYVFLIPSVNSDFQIHESTNIGDDSLQLLWVVPITGSERSFLAAQGMARFCWLLDEHHHRLAFDPYRHCYVDTASSNQAV